LLLLAAGATAAGHGTFDVLPTGSLTTFYSTNNTFSATYFLCRLLPHSLTTSGEGCIVNSFLNTQDIYLMDSNFIIHMLYKTFCDFYNDYTYIFTLSD